MADLEIVKKRKPCYLSGAYKGWIGLRASSIKLKILFFLIVVYRKNLSIFEKITFVLRLVNNIYESLPVAVPGSVGLGLINFYVHIVFNRSFVTVTFGLLALNCFYCV